jgi:hypothetical protein
MMRSSRLCLKIREVTITSFNSYREYARSIVRIAVKSCSKALFAGIWRHGKSPCFRRCSVFALVDVDLASANFAVVDVKEILE